tara:strand:+ start:1 stop:1704 length:1704 start_codon:yes stop_codon:yes gene_type:complete
MAGVGRGAGQAGIQFQQFIGQVQGGQSAMLALSQQSADLGFVLGAPLLGAIVGISASLIGILAPALLKTIEATKDFKFNVEEAAKELENLNDLSKAQVSVALKNTNKSMGELAKAAGVAGNGIASINQQLDSGVREWIRYGKNGQAVIETSKLTAEETKKLKEELAQEQATLDKINQEYKRQSDLLVKLSENKDGFSKKTNKQTTEIEKLSLSLTAQTLALEEGEEAAFRYATAQQLGLKVGEMLPANIDAQIAALFKLKKAKEDATKADTAQAKLTGQVQGLGVSPEEAIKIRLEKELELLRLAQEQKIEIDGTYQERRIELQRQADEKIARLNKKQTEESVVNYEALENQIIGTFASIASGAQDGKDAIRSLAQSILTQMIGALIKMGIQSLIGQTTTTAAGVANAATLATAYAPAAALASLASFGANAAPASAGIASTIALSQGAAIAGGRQFGGGVSKGNNYRINEGGSPEVISSGGKDFLMNSPGGNVKQIEDVVGNSGVTVNVNNMAAGVDVQATPSADGKTIDIAVRRTVAELTNQVSSGNGKFINALRSSTNMTTKASR